jgi:hypothetical protein
MIVSVVFGDVHCITMFNTCISKGFLSCTHELCAGTMGSSQGSVLVLDRTAASELIDCPLSIQAKTDLSGSCNHSNLFCNHSNFFVEQQVWVFCA